MARFEISGGNGDPNFGVGIVRSAGWNPNPPDPTRCPANCWPLSGVYVVSEDGLAYSAGPAKRCPTCGGTGKVVVVPAEDYRCPECRALMVPTTGGGYHCGAGCVPLRAGEEG